MAESGNTCPKISSTQGTKTQSEEGRGQAEMPGRQGAAGHQPGQNIALSSPLLSATPPTPPCRLRSPTTAPRRWAARPKGPGDWLQHSTITPAASALHTISVGQGAAGGSLGASQSRSSASTSHTRAEAAPRSQCKSSTSLVSAGIHRQPHKLRGTSLPSDSTSCACEASPLCQRGPASSQALPGAQSQSSCERTADWCPWGPWTTGKS